MRSWQAIRRPLLISLLFVLLSAITLSPLSFHLGSLAPSEYEGELDYYHFHWNLWWVRHAIQTGQNPFYTDMVLAPFEHNLSYHSLTAIWLPVYAALEPLIGHLRTANAIIWLCIVLTGVLMVAFLRRQGISLPVALLGGIALAFSPYMLDHAASGHLNLITVFWLPVALLLWEQMINTRRVGWAIGLGIGLWALWLTDTLIVFWAGLLLAPCALLALVQAPDRRARIQIVLLGGIALVITFLLAWFLGPLKPTLDFDTSQLEPARMLTLRHFSMPVRSLVLPGLGSAHQRGIERDERLGLLLIVLTWAGLLVRTKDRQRWFWLIAALPPLILTLGPDVEIFGTRFPLPFRLIHEAFGGQMRTPIRYLPPATFALIVFVARTYDPWVRRIRPVMARGALLAAVFFALIVDNGILKPYPATNALPEYDLYTMMGEEHYDDYDYVVLEVPSGPYTGWRLLGSHPEAMAYGVVHEKRMVSGLLSRIELDQHLFYEKSPLMGWLTGERPLDAGPVMSELGRVVDEWPVGYVVVHQDWLPTTDRAQEIFAVFNAHPSLCYIGVERDAVLYRTSSHPKGCPPRTPPEVEPEVYRLDLGEPGDEGFIGHGWYWQETFGGISARWAGDSPSTWSPDEPLREALLYADLPTGSAYTLTVRAAAFAEPRTVKVVANAVRLGEWTIAPDDFREYSLTIPADLVEQVSGKLIISLSADGIASAAELGISADARLITVAYDWVTFQRADGS
ncbi:MAG: hypothetical protein JXJ20_11825 [Anaerolineae bacterium]|nr:hypothetical protein [Anaerolineae bacterium]